MLSDVILRPHRMDRSTSVDDRVALHPLVQAAAEGVLPDWSVAGPQRLLHMARVAALLDSWADGLGLPIEERARWRAAGYLHDSLRDAPAASLRALAGSLGDISDPLLHGPAAAQRLRTDGVADEELLAAVAFHTTGDPAFRRLGRALYAADFLEPGRTYLGEREVELRARAPRDLDAVVLEVVRARAAYLDGRMDLHPRTKAFLGTLEAELHG
ncbi:MAG: HD domain-containing protein [Gemmatimonadota bacterium]|nr:HD domain-containing protein [Gemmatimonadota bacterium]MDH3421436.1 HD domain-containing protein [Gemmatimonadota bacterium]